MTAKRNSVIQVNVLSRAWVLFFKYVLIYLVPYFTCDIGSVYIDKFVLSVSLTAEYLLFKDYSIVLSDCIPGIVSVCRWAATKGQLCGLSCLAGGTVDPRVLR